MDNKYTENLGASSDDRDEAEDLFLRVVKRNDQQSHEASQNKHINNMAENNRSELNAETRAIPKIQQKQGNASASENPSMPQRRTPQRELKKPMTDEQNRNIPSAIRKGYSGRRDQKMINQSSGYNSVNKKAVEQTPLNTSRQMSGRISNSLPPEDSAATSYFNKVSQVRNYPREADMSATIQQRPISKNNLAVRTLQPSRGKKGRRGRGKRNSDNYKGTALSSVLKAVIYIVSVFVIAGLIGYYGIQIGNDVFAFVKSDAEIEITIDENTSTSELASLLKKNKVVSSEDLQS